MKQSAQPRDVAAWNEISIEQIKELGSAEESSRKQSSKFLHTDDQRLKSELYRTEKSQKGDPLIQDSLNSGVYPSVKAQPADRGDSGNIVIEEQNIKPEETPYDNSAIPGFDHSKILKEGADVLAHSKEPELREGSRDGKGTSSLTVSQPISIEANLLA
mmetsp:Transcript_30573/g.46874  ORF Transcript_30573/g.46874 Transcript_30573/m.46874 type:complete len:159 (+) Transcript_30573:1019-1495(+)|eukprot:CAMPEP_0170488452 /NCGR_PEP_ID=MMETSP0208-20121228/7002_1 /TAXON_ID=197538 /ORGANISM="Strombidium inclinatum, Strain S3" /LENGTH=158 /DNA_ID=CAMNT_0010763023 /DNA_START=765 /DNA_END=1241 /DNA_ORIENTATION=-